jgi:hypothetical protein
MASAESQAMPDKDKLDLYVGLFKFYLELIVKVDVFVAAIVGGIMAFGITKVDQSSPFSARLGLFMVPAGVCFALGVIAWRYFTSAKEMQAAVEHLGGSLGLAPPPHVKLLVDVTLVSSITYFLLCAGILVVAFALPLQVIPSTAK